MFEPSRVKQEPSEKYGLFSILLLCSQKFIRGELWEHESIPLE